MIFSSKLRQGAALFAIGISAAMPLAPVLRSVQSGATNQEKRSRSMDQTRKYSILPTSCVN